MILCPCADILFDRIGVILSVRSRQTVRGKRETAKLQAGFMQLILIVDISAYSMISSAQGIIGDP